MQLFDKEMISQARFSGFWHGLLKNIMGINQFNHMKRAIVVVFAMFGLMCGVVAQKPAVVMSDKAGWHKIGEITASFKMQNESIVVWGADEFKAIKLKVTDAPINIERMEVFYEDGTSEQINVTSQLKVGAETRVINLRKPEAELSKVAFTYKTLPNYSGEKAEIELYGLKTASDSYRDDRTDVDNKVDEAHNEVNEESREANQELKEEAREADREIDETGKEIRQESREANQEMKEEAREADRKLDNTGDKMERETDKVENELSEAAGNVGAEIKDKPYVDKVGPDGQRIYMDKHSKYYYIDEKGNKVYITKMQMKDNPKKD
jgi:F0F1-type ATP synthase membrane subunit b/b'